MDSLFSCVACLAPINVSRLQGTGEEKNKIIWPIHWPIYVSEFMCVCCAHVLWMCDDADVVVQCAASVSWTRAHKMWLYICHTPFHNTTNAIISLQRTSIQLIVFIVHRASFDDGGDDDETDVAGKTKAGLAVSCININVITSKPWRD